MDDASNDARRYVQLGFQTKEKMMSIGCIFFDTNVGIMGRKYESFAGMENTLVQIRMNFISGKLSIHPQGPN